MKLRILLPLLLCLAVPARADDAQERVFSDAANKFYAAYIKLGVRGLPDDAMRAKLAPVITWSLEQELKSALDAQKRFAAAMKGEVPPLIDGDLFTSLYEGATSYTVRACKQMAAGANCIVALTYDDKSGKPTTWEDTAILRQEKDGWQVDDIQYGGKWAFANAGTLKESLKAAVSGVQ
jgi:hypothetical protein